MVNPLKHSLYKNRSILFCHCSYANLVPESKRLSVRKALHLLSDSVLDVPDLCAWAAEKNPKFMERKNKPITIFACHSRAVKSLLSHAGWHVENSNLLIVNMRKESEEDILVQLSSGSHDEKPNFKIPEFEKGNWIPWFPVIDPGRCKNCKQCASFCLFGVYSVENDHVKVQNPQNCKTNCPACARICPEAAIIFPKCQESPINGDEIANEDKVRANIKVNIDQILGDDIYASLAERRKKAKEMMKDPAFQKAQLERMQFLNPSEK